ncbi:MAG TPA: MBL fold metallo-hydrolase [Candidatus Magasanikbacteria bacterium]|nr:MBL fold metallo-hydrolase [Candidatus Magasanikbacteria bacterium]
MHISWLGQSAFKIETKTPLKEEVSILINPYNLPKSDLPRNLKSDLVLLTNGKENTITLSGEPFIISTPGEYEIQGVMVYAFQVPTENEKDKPQLIFHFETELMSLTFLGAFQGKLTDEMIDKLGLVDIVLLPVGGKNVLSADEANNLVGQIEPRVVIPHSFSLPNKNDGYEPVDKFAKLLGQKDGEWLPKLKIVKRDLPQEETKLVLLNKA